MINYNPGEDSLTITLADVWDELTLDDKLLLLARWNYINDCCETLATLPFIKMKMCAVEEARMDNAPWARPYFKAVEFLQRKLDDKT